MLNRIRKLGSLPMLLLAWWACASLAAIGGWWLVSSFATNPMAAMFGGSAPPGRVKTLGSNVVDSLAWSPDGRYLAAGASIWDVDGGRRVEVLGAIRGGVSSVSWSPDGKYLVTAASEPSNTLRIWDTTNWQAIFITDPVPNTDKTTTSVTSVSWSPDSKHIAIGLATSTGSGVDYLRQIGTKSLLKIYDVPSGSNSATLIYPSIHGIGSVDWSSDGKTILFSVDPDDPSTFSTVVLLWDLSAGDGPSSEKNTRQLLREDALLTLTYVRWSPDGKYIAGNSADNSVKIFEASTGDLKHVLSADGETSLVAWSPDGTRIAAGIRGAAAKGAHSEYVQVWDASGEQTVAIFGTGPINHTLAWSPDSKRLATSSGALVIGSTAIWGFDDTDIVPTATPIPSPPSLRPGNLSVLGSHSDSVMRVAWSPDGNWLASCGNDKRVRVWEMSTGRTIATLRLFGWVESVAWSPDGKYLAIVANGTPGVQVWDTSTWQLYREWDVGGVVSVAWSPNGQKLAFGRGEYLESPEGRLIVVDMARAIELKELGLPEHATYVDWSADGKYLAVANGRETIDSKPSVWVWDTSSWHVVAQQRVNRSVTDLEWSPDSKLLAFASWSREVGIFDVTTMRQDDLLSDGDTRDLSWAPDSSSLATTSDRNAVQVWDLASRQSTLHREVFEGASSVAVSPDGRYIALGAWDGFVRVSMIK